MQPIRFDTLVRSLGRPASRRGAVGILAGVTGLGLGVQAVTAAKPLSCDGPFQKRCGDACIDINFQRCCTCPGGTKVPAPAGTPCRQTTTCP
jgi:hypothetical protein